MKTLINKNNPLIRITAPEIELWIGSAFVIGQNLSGTTDNRGIALVVGRNGWILIKEEENISFADRLKERLSKMSQEEIDKAFEEMGGDNDESPTLEEYLKAAYHSPIETEPVDLEKESEDYANKEYPDEPSVGQFGTGDYEPLVDREYLREIAKDAFKKGAEWQKERDELTWKDLQKLDIIANELWQDGKYDKNDAQEFYTEVLKRFKEYKEQKNK